MKKVYIAHPLRGDFDTNMKKVEDICKGLVEKGEVIPFSPLHAFSFFDPKGNQELVMAYCYALLDSCDEIWLHNGWENSEGCKLEAKYCIDKGISLKIIE